MDSQPAEISDAIKLVLPEIVGLNEVKELQSSFNNAAEYSEIVVDASKVSLISTSGLQLLLSLNISAKNKNAKITILNSSEYLIGVVKKLSLYDQLIKD